MKGQPGGSLIPMSLIGMEMALKNKKSNIKNACLLGVLSEAKNLSFVAQILRLRLRMTLPCHFAFYILIFAFGFKAATLPKSISDIRI